MTIYLSIISHHHDEIISQLKTLSRLSKHANIKIILRDNIKSKVLEQYCHTLGVEYFGNDRKCGFSKNNNLNFMVAMTMGLTASDYFVMLNPDIDICDEMIQQLIVDIEKTTPPLLAPNLFIDSHQTVVDDNLRLFPTLGTFFLNYLFNDRSTVIDRTKALPSSAFWASGAFLIVRGDVYQMLNGLDETYFMYCEDVDFCLRAHREGFDITYLPAVRATHYRRCDSRRFGSKLFFQHVKSTVLYELTRRGWRQCWHRKSALLKASLADDTAIKGKRS
uniref:glycosyltransferase family 2 protein n=1 Tax=Thaumasiovibrio occultus TaxID=1891184 RepID=UPI000B362EB4|nr:glycosyltransferase family 2 protein [Thaumasiovibrio occultus]